MHRSRCQALCTTRTRSRVGRENDILTWVNDILTWVNDILTWVNDILTSASNLKASRLFEEISIMLLTRASCSCKGGDRTVGFHRWTVIRVGSDTASQGKARCTAPSLMFQCTSSLVSVPLKIITMPWMRMESTRKKREFFAWIVIYNVNDTAFSLVQFFRQNSWIANLLPG